MAENLFNELQNALLSGNKSLAEEIQRKILLSDRDEAIDKELIDNIRGKTLYKNIVRAMKEDNNLSYNDYMKLVSSLITHNIIECEVSSRDISQYPVKKLYIILGNFVNGDIENAKEEFKRFLQDRYSKFI